ncbi:MAG TPA: hypothetical protein VHZ02_09845 [Acidimicrobiales bacterium]|jgi:multisubunit Na+/H+ antiporter MnhE subunit|nr:hypothetical protein [Acidimicrobiales bacterium]
MPGAIVETLALSAGALGVWLLSLSSVSSEELLVGGSSALACGVVAAIVRRKIDGHWSLAWDLVRPVLCLPGAIAADTLGVLASPWRARKKRARYFDVDIGAAGSSPRATARRAIASLVVSASPGSVVVAADPETGRLTVHSFASAGTRLEDRFEHP